VDAATRQVERGAHQIGQGQVLVGAGELAKGIGNTIVEGAPIHRPEARGGRAERRAGRPERVGEHEGRRAAAFGSGIRDFFVDLFGG
jgi:hypothetical protein